MANSNVKSKVWGVIGPRVFPALILICITLITLGFNSTAGEIDSKLDEGVFRQFEQHVKADITQIKDDVEKIKEKQEDIKQKIDNIDKNQAETRKDLEWIKRILEKKIK
jgi:low affinity Fe/Cu permease